MTYERSREVHFLDLLLWETSMTVIIGVFCSQTPSHIKLLLHVFAYLHGLTHLLTMKFMGYCKNNVGDADAQNPCEFVGFGGVKLRTPRNV